MTDIRIQRLFIWMTIVGLTIFAVGFAAFAQLIPAQAPHESPQAIADHFRDNADLKRVGMMMALMGSGLGLPFMLVLFFRMKKVEGDVAPCAYLQLVSGILSAVPGGWIPLMAWTAIAFRPDRDPETLRLLNDIAWLGFLVPWIAALQIFAVGLCAFRDTEQKVFPRWFGYLSLWETAIFVPAAAVIFFKHGPFAWNGLVAWYIPLATFGIWFGIAIVLMLNSLKREEEEMQQQQVFEPEAVAAT